MSRFHVREATAAELHWLEYHADVRLDLDARALCALDSSGKVRGAVAFDNFRDGTCAAHQAGVPVAVRALLPAAMSFAFETLGVAALRGSVCSDNLRALAFNRRLGFREASRLADFYGPGRDRVFLRLSRAEAARWLRKECA